ncbi:VanW family protein [Deinococcus sp. QL22]|uniref:VanW family protein n=1 Tax=Deinococcus sp. QL22 TaxID=2939437 RepID=UPI002017B07C|nr:VanW family protein [Deinococcus sp. QL22]UQN10063.1 VanW family protein [Deinococcus sp. QL22]
MTVPSGEEAGRDAPRPTEIQLLWSVPEPLLQGGEVSRPLVNRSLTLPLTAQQVSAVQMNTVQAEGRADGQQSGGGVETLRPTLETLYAQVEARQPREIRFVRQGNGWIGQAQTGWKVDRAATEAALLRAVRRGERRSTLSVNLVAPARSVAWAAAQGLAHLGTGESSFTGSPDFRVHNVRVGASRVHGLWMAPGAEFNFNRSIGAISANTGFLQGYVVTGNTLSIEDGGGLCQVSTTVFRAAFRAGLPITERHAHSYQVGYYGDPGLDAAVYAPSKNLRWRNDTAGVLLVQADWDIQAARLSVHLFGRPDGRQVQIGEPKLSGTRTAPPPTFIADPQMASGTVRRIDMPAAGAQVTVSRQIKFAGGRTRSENLPSTYRAWGGVFAVPPGDDRLSGPE